MSAPLFASTSLTVCTAVLPFITYLPNEETITGVPPMVISIPSQPLTSCFNVPSVTLVTKGVWELASLTQPKIAMIAIVVTIDNREPVFRKLATALLFF